MILDIVAVARESGMPASTLRFYEQKGLIQSVGRRGLKRVFERSVLQRLALISLGVQAGFSLDAIRDMFSEDGRPRVDRGQLLAKADELDETIKKLAALRDTLRHTARCPAPSHLECPTFQRMLRAAGSGRSRQSRVRGLIRTS